ncbi:MAG: squalene/phytoene synthase family protein, partial [Armatimonadota bacterium]
MNKNNPNLIMKNNSKTFFNSSLFFPKAVRSKVMTLYAFVRTADDFVDSIPQDKDGFIEFRNQYESALDGKHTGNFIIDDFAALKNKTNIPNDWVDSFLESMEQDLYKIEYKNIAETQAYMYGSAEVVGLMMARVMALPDESFEYARLLGRAFQYLNIIRDVK